MRLIIIESSVQYWILDDHNLQVLTESLLRNQFLINILRRCEREREFT